MNPYEEWADSCQNISIEPGSVREMSNIPSVSQEELNNSVQVSFQVSPVIISEVFHFKKIENLKAFIRTNIRGLLETYTSSLSDAERNIVAKEVIENILDDNPSTK